MAALPELLTGYYYEFFSSHPQTQLGHSILRSLVRLAHVTHNRCLNIPKECYLVGFAGKGRPRHSETE
jgi:hypothetical protein